MTDGKEFIRGMFIAEAIKTDSVYYYPDEDRNFDFSAMCKTTSIDHWGSNTCIPSFSSGEYRKYLLYIAQKGIDEGIQDFLFGQIYFQDNLSKTLVDGEECKYDYDTSSSLAEDIVTEIRQYERSMGKRWS